MRKKYLWTSVILSALCVTLASDKGECGFSEYTVPTAEDFRTSILSKSLPSSQWNDDAPITDFVMTGGGIASTRPLDGWSFFFPKCGMNALARNNSLQLMMVEPPQLTSKKQDEWVLTARYQLIVNGEPISGTALKFVRGISCNMQDSSYVVDR